MSLLGVLRLTPVPGQVSSRERRLRRPPDRVAWGRFGPQESTRVRVSSTLATLLLASSFHKPFHTVAGSGLR
jgi:hypothetical protein